MILMQEPNGFEHRFPKSPSHSGDVAALTFTREIFEAGTTVSQIL